MTKIRWRISSYSGQNGSCVEIGVTRISSYSASGGSCVAVTETDDDVLVRNSNQPDRGCLAFDRSAVAAFVAASSAGEYDDLA